MLVHGMSNHQLIFNNNRSLQKHACMPAWHTHTYICYIPFTNTSTNTCLCLHTVHLSILPATFSNWGHNSRSVEISIQSLHAPSHAIKAKHVKQPKLGGMGHGLPCMLWPTLGGMGHELAAMSLELEGLHILHFLSLTLAASFAMFCYQRKGCMLPWAQLLAVFSTLLPSTSTLACNHAWMMQCIISSKLNVHTWIARLIVLNLHKD